MGLVSGIVVHHVVDDVPTIASSVIGGAIGDVDLGLHLEMVLHFSKTFRGDVGRVIALNAGGSIDHALLDLATADGGSSAHITAVCHAIDLDVTWSLSVHVEGHDIGLSLCAIRVIGSDFEVVFAKENVLESDDAVVGSVDGETIAEIASLTKGNRVFVKGLSRRNFEIPSELDWERVAVPFLSAWKGRNWVIHILASVLEIGFLSWGVDFLDGAEIGRDHESVSGRL